MYGPPPNPLRAGAHDAPSSLSRFQDHLPEACVIVSRSGQILAQTPGARKSLGTAAGTFLSDLTVEPAGRLEAYIARCFGSRSFVPGRFRFSMPGGETRTYRSHGAAVRWPGKENGVLIILRTGEQAPADTQLIRLQRRIEELTREVRRRRASEERLEREKKLAEEANRRRSESLAAISHELRTPLHSIMGYLKLLERGVGGSLQPEQETRIERIRRATEHLSALIHTSLTFSALEAGMVEPKLEDTDAVRIASEALELVAPGAVEKGIVCSLQKPMRSIRLRTDPGQMRQMLVNLLSNGIKFADAGRVSLAVRRERRWVIFEVEDTGPGIREEDLERIFEPFCRGEAHGAHGTGLGLTVTRRLARLLGGDVEVKSVPGCGSTFVLRLPLSDPSPHPEMV